MSKLKDTCSDTIKLTTPRGTSEFTMHSDEKDGKKILVRTVATTVLHNDARCVDDLYSMLKQRGNWMEIGYERFSVAQSQPCRTPITEL